MPITIQQLQSDPAFLSLPDAEKLKGLSETLPGFSDLPPSEQRKALADFPAAGKPSLVIQPSSSGPEFNPDMYPMDLPAAKNALSLLPVLGTWGGTALGARFRNPELGSIIGAATGSAVDQFTKRYLPGGDEIPDEERIKAVMGNAALAPFGVGASRAVNPAMEMTDDAARAVKYAAENELPIKLSEVSPSFATKFMDETSTLGFLGRYAEVKWAQKANTFLANVRNTVLGKLTGVKDIEKMPIDSIPGKVRPALRLNTEGAYKEALDLVKMEKDAAAKGWEASRYGEDIPIKLTNMRTAAGELLKDSAVQNAKKNKRAAVAPAEWLKNFLDKSEKGLSFTDIHKLESEINKTLYGAGAANTKIHAELAKDLTGWDGALGEQLNNLYQVARSKSKNEFLFNDVYALLRGATIVDRQTKGEILNGSALLAKLQTPVKGSFTQTPEKKIIEYLGEKEGAAVVQDLRDLANYAIYTQGLRSEGGKILDLKTIVGGGAMTAGGGYGGGIAGVLVPQGTSLAMTVLLTGPEWKGGLRNYLLQGVKPTLRLGVKSAIQGAGSLMLDPTQGGAIPLRQE